MGEPGDKASGFVESRELSYERRAILGTRATQPTLPNGPTSTTTVIHVDSVPP